MMIRTGNKRLRRSKWKARGHVHIKFNRGIWLRPEVVDPEGVSLGMAQQVIGGAEQPRAYTEYPHP